jgi:hypothetical protein
MQFRIADTFTDSLAKLTGDEQKVEERRHPPGGPLVGGQRFRMLTVTLRNGVELFRFSTGQKPTIGVFDTVDDEIAAVAGWLGDREAHALRLREIARLRMIVGYLEEKGRHNWWPSEFFSATAPAFLNPVFGKTATLAQYHGVREAARRVHDEHIGVGREFHLFCLPEAIEKAVFEAL